MGGTVTRLRTITNRKKYWSNTVRRPRNSRLRTYLSVPPDTSEAITNSRDWVSALRARCWQESVSSWHDVGPPSPDVHDWQMRRGLSERTGGICRLTRCMLQCGTSGKAEGSQMLRCVCRHDCGVCQTGAQHCRCRERSWWQAMQGTVRVEVGREER